MEQKILSQNLELLVGQERAKTLLAKCLVSGQYRSYLLVGPPRVGKGFLARLLAVSWHGEVFPARPHPDTLTFDDILTKNSFEAEENQWKKSVDDFIHFMHLSPVKSKVKVGIIEDIDRFSIQALNALLKTLEEPPRDVVFILTAQEISNVLPTILSRVQIVRLSYLSDADITQYLESVNASHIDEITVLANGAIGIAKRLTGDTELLDKALKGVTSFQTILHKDILAIVQDLNIKERSEAIELIHLWLNLAHRMLLCKMGYPISSLVNDLAENYSQTEIVDLVEKLKSALADLEDNANVRITLEDVALSVVG